MSDQGTQSETLTYPLTAIEFVGGKCVEKHAPGRRSALLRLIGDTTDEQGNDRFVVLVSDQRLKAPHLELVGLGSGWVPLAVTTAPRRVPVDPTQSHWATVTVVGGFEEAPPVRPHVALVLVHESRGRKGRAALANRIAGREVRESRNLIEMLEGFSPTELRWLFLDTLRSTVEEWEQRFLRGENFTTRTHRAIERAVQELTGLRDNGLSPELKASRRGLLASLGRLLDAQASRDATGAVERVISIFASLVLVPGLVASVYGANVSGPLFGSVVGWRVMIAMMAIGGAITYLTLTALRPSAKTRRIKFHVPGAPWREDDQDYAWLSRLIPAGLAGAAFGVGLAAITYLPDLALADSAPSTFAGLCVGLAILALGVGIAAGADWKKRSKWHAGLDVLVAALAAGVSGLFLSDDWMIAVTCVVLLATSILWFSDEEIRRSLSCRVPDLKEQITRPG